MIPFHDDPRLESARRCLEPCFPPSHHLLGAADVECIRGIGGLHTGIQALGTSAILGAFTSKAGDKSACVQEEALFGAITSATPPAPIIKQQDLSAADNLKKHSILYNRSASAA